MATEREPGGYQTAEFFESNPRSAQLRRVCLPMAHALDDMVIAEAVASPTTLDRLHEPFIQGREMLATLGIVPGMHDDEDPARRNANPVTLAEFIAGRLIMLDQNRIQLISRERMTERVAFWALNSLGVPVDRRLDPISDR